MPTHKVSKDLKGEYGRCLFKRAQSYLVLVKVAAVFLVNLLHLVLLLKILCFSLCCTAPSCTILYVLHCPALSCTILYHPVPSCTILYHPVPSCTFCSMLYHPVPYYTTLYDILPDFDTVYVFEHRALWSHCRLDLTWCWAVFRISARCVPAE